MRWHDFAPGRILASEDGRDPRRPTWDAKTLTCAAPAHAAPAHAAPAHAALTCAALACGDADGRMPGCGCSGNSGKKIEHVRPDFHRVDDHLIAAVENEDNDLEHPSL